MVKAVGFRNLIVHEYGKLDLKRAYDISQNDIKDLDTFLKAVIKKI
ncbi:HepT-like ribonuclease domain-containing protein [Desulfobacula sp.]